MSEIDDTEVRANDEAADINLPPGVVTAFKLLRAVVGVGLIAAVVLLAFKGAWVTAIVLLIATPFVLGLFEAVFLVWPASAWMWIRQQKR